MLACRLFFGDLHSLVVRLVYFQEPHRFRERTRFVLCDGATKKLAVRIGPVEFLDLGVQGF